LSIISACTEINSSGVIRCCSASVGFGYASLGLSRNGALATRGGGDLAGLFLLFMLLGFAFACVACFPTPFFKYLGVLIFSAKYVFTFIIFFTLGYLSKSTPSSTSASCFSPNISCSSFSRSPAGLYPLLFFGGALLAAFIFIDVM
jgi:hypothetical protein